MHEVSVCQSMLKQVEEIAQQQHARLVTSIRVRVGPLSGIEPQLLSHAFPVVSAGTIAEDAHLVFEPSPIRVKCKLCGEESDAEISKLVCGLCGHWQTQLLSGDEMLLASVEVEK